MNGIAPAVDARSRILILGSFPGPMSLAKKEYYAYPHNKFWKIVFDVLGIGMPDTYAGKTKALKNNRIGLWDAIGSCRREGASDGNISDALFNDIASLVGRYPGIKEIFCNGNKAYSACAARYKDIGVPFTYLPSTSPANAGRSYAYKKRQWKKILRPL